MPVSHETYMQRCLQLAEMGMGHVAPNPMVGAVVVYKDTIIGEGYHKQFGGAHAEVEAISSVAPGDQHLIKQSTMYVSLEPCNHRGKTPPCTNLIIDQEISKVIIGTTDPNPQVAGTGINRLQDAGISVEVGVLEEEAKALNKRFFTFHQKKRPYVILKWAQSQDGYIGHLNSPTPLSNSKTNRLVHRWRTEEAAILVGTKTALIDNPRLDNRHWPGKPPLRIVIDQFSQLPNDSFLLDQSQPTLVLTESPQPDRDNLLFRSLSFEQKLFPELMSLMFEMEIQSVLVEGGAEVHRQFLEASLWDELRVITTPHMLHDGVKAAPLAGEFTTEYSILSDQITHYHNRG